MSIKTQLDRIKTSKESIATAIENKGVNVPADALIDDFASYISQIKSNPVLQEKSVTPTTTAQSVTADSGYDGLSKVNVGAIQTQEKSATPTTSAQAITPDSGKYLSKVTVGAIPSTYVKPTATKTATTYTPTTSNQTIAAGTYCSGAQTIKGDSNLVAANIKSGVSIFGVAGNFAGAGLQYATGTVTPSVTSTSSSGTTIFSVSGLSFTPKFVAVWTGYKFSSFGSKYNIGAVFGGLASGVTNYDASVPRLDDEIEMPVTLTSNGFIVKTDEAKQHNFSSSYRYIAIG